MFFWFILRMTVTYFWIYHRILVAKSWGGGEGGCRKLAIGCVWFWLCLTHAIVALWVSHFPTIYACRQQQRICKVAEHKSILIEFYFVIVHVCNNQTMVQSMKTFVVIQFDDYVTMCHLLLIVLNSMSPLLIMDPTPIPLDPPWRRRAFWSWLILGHHMFESSCNKCFVRGSMTNIITLMLWNTPTYFTVCTWSMAKV